MAKQRRHYTREFKVEAVRRIAAEGESLAEIARELGLGESPPRSWKTALTAEGEQAFPGKGHLPAVEEELRRLRAEDQRPRMGREIFKRATAFFAGESSWDINSSTTIGRSSRPG